MKTDVCKVWFETVAEVCKKIDEMYTDANNEYVLAEHEFNDPGGMPFKCYNDEVAPLKERAEALKYCLQLLDNPNKIFGQISKRNKNE